MAALACVSNHMEAGGGGGPQGRAGEGEQPLRTACIACSTTSVGS